jgi:hypothetical protein
MPTPPASKKFPRHLLFFALFSTAALSLALFPPQAIPLAPSVPPTPNQDQPAQWTLASYVASGLWAASLAILALLAVLSLSRPLWRRAWSASPLPFLLPSSLSRSQPGRPKTPFLACLALALASASALSLPRFSHSLWDDEDRAAGRHVTGMAAWEDGPDAPPTFLPASWLDTAFGYRSPSNHFAFSLSTRLVHEAAWARGLPRHQIVEPLFRVIPFAAGLAALVLWSLLARACAGDLAGSLAALSLSLHPWFLRFLTEGRGYSLAILFFALSLFALRRALDPTRPQGFLPWGSYALAQFLMMYSWPGMAAQALVTNTAAALALPWLLISPTLRLPTLLRLVTANLATLSLLAIFFIAPCLPQAAAFAAQHISFTPGRHHFETFAAHLFLGQDARDWYADPSINPLYTNLERLSASSWLPPVALMALAAACALAGAIRLGRHSGAHARWLLPSLLLGAPLLVTAFSLRSLYPFPSYVFFALPPLVLLASAGLAWPFERCLRPAAPAPHKALALATPFLALAAFAYLAAPKIELLRRAPLEQMREATRLARPWPDPHDPQHASVLTAMVHMPSHVYDPFAWQIDSLESVSPDQPGLARLMLWADLHGLELFVNVGHPIGARESCPELMAMLEHPATFELAHILWGQEPQLTRHLYRYRGTSP